MLFDSFPHDQRFSCSVAENLLGNVWDSEKILRQERPRPKLGRYGWAPSSSRYRDRLTGDQFNVLIDHVLVSQSLKFENPLVWNPYLKDAPDQVKDLKAKLKDASDHFPVSVDITL